jgi:hypothetical protein
MAARAAAWRACASSSSASMSSQARTKASASAAMATTPEYGPTTSRIGVLTIGRPAAMYSSVLVGLM